MPTVASVEIGALLTESIGSDSGVCAFSMGISTRCGFSSTSPTLSSLFSVFFADWATSGDKGADIVLSSMNLIDKFEYLSAGSSSFLSKLLP